MTNIEPFGYFKAEPFGWTDCAETAEGAVPLYDQAAIASVKHAERERAVSICTARAAKIEAEAQRAIDNGEHDEVSCLRSAAWQLTVAANEIKADTE